MKGGNMAKAILFDRTEEFRTLRSNDYSAAGARNLQARLDKIEKQDKYTGMTIKFGDFSIK